MKKLGKLKLNILSQQSLESREMNVLRGGVNVCRCSCYWVDQGGSSAIDNSQANYKIGDGYSEHGSNCYITDTDADGNSHTQCGFSGDCRV